jgi:large subunit ribosomal protein L24
MAVETKTRRKMLIRRGDTVQVISGNDSGVRGRVLRAYPQDERVVIEHVNIRKKHQRPMPAGRSSQTQAGIIQFEAPVHVSNVMIVCPNCDKPTRIGVRRDEAGVVRVCKKCGEDIA